MQEVLNKIVEYSFCFFQGKLTGVYLHGSIAMGCFNPMKSDMDILVIVEDAVIDFQKKTFINSLISLNDYLPAKKFCLSTPYEFHYSNMYYSWYKSNPDDYIKKMSGTDYDLAAHFVIVKKRGIVLYGKEIDDVFGKVPPEAYLDSIKRDIVDAEKQVIDNPIYIVLNLCRALAYVEDGLILSKKEGGEWAIKNIHEKYHKLIEEALICYASDKKMNLDYLFAVEFCRYMKYSISINY